MSPRPLVLVGMRRGLLPALRRCGRPAVALVGGAEKLAGLDGLLGAAVVDLHGPAEEIAAVTRGLLAGAEPAAVVALAERTVLASARLRAELGVAGNPVSAALCCADKLEMKRAMQAAGVPVARWCALAADTDAEVLARDLGLPIVLKPRRDSGGRGQRLVHTEAELERSLGELPALATGWLAEGWIDGVEMSVESFVAGGEVLFANPTEYLVPRHANVLPATLAPGEARAVLTLNAQAIAAAGVERGITHLELFRTERGPVFGELASRPPGGRLMPLLRRAWGFAPWDALLALELGRPFPFPAHPRRVAATWLLHPGPGRLSRLEGVADARRLPLVRKVVVRVAPGGHIGPRAGSGQDVGYIDAEGEGREVVVAALRQAVERVRFILE